MTVGISKFKSPSPPCLKQLSVSVQQIKTKKNLDMKTHHVTTASSSVKSSTTATMEERDSCYFPGCRKDANCNCEICIASINATLDLMPISIQKSSLTKVSASRPNVERTPVSFDSSFISTPRSSYCRKLESPALKSTARLRFSKMEEKRKRECSYGRVFLRLILGLSLFFALEIGFSCGVCRVLRPVFSSDMVRSVGERSWVVEDLSGQLRFLQTELKGLVTEGKISNCSYVDSNWEINQDGLLLNSQCVLYKSVMEEVSIWGWPLQTAGLLKTGFSWRSFTVLSGRVTEWSDGRVGYSIRRANTSWVQRKWAASVVQLDPNTWVLEYRRNSIFSNSGLLAAVAELFKYRMSRVIKRMTQVFSLFSALHEEYSEFTAKKHIKSPT